MSEVEHVLREAMPLIGAAVGVYGAGVLAKTENAAAEATVNLGKRILDRIWHRADQPAPLEAAVADLAQSPQDPDALGALRLQIRKVLSRDPSLLGELATLLPAGSLTIASGDRSVAIGGENSGAISTGDGAIHVHG